MALISLTSLPHSPSKFLFKFAGVDSIELHAKIKFGLPRFYSITCKALNIGMKVIVNIRWLVQGVELLGRKVEQIPYICHMYYNTLVQCGALKYVRHHFNILFPAKVLYYSLTTKHGIQKSKSILI